MESINTVSDGYVAADTSAVGKPERSRTKRVMRIMGYGFASLIVIITLLNLLWTMSGSNQWKLEIDENNVQVYSLKSPGSYLKQYRAVMQADYTLNHLVAGLIENSTLDICKKHIPSCVDVQVIEPWSAKTMSDTVLWKLALPDPFMPRETLIRSQVSQDPTTKVVTVDVIAAPNAAPRNPDSIRLTHMQNRWIYTPLENGKVEIEFLQDIDMGGLFPDFLLNIGGAEETYKFIHDQLPALLDREDLRNTTYDFIEEL